ncbi:MAG: hypothetical protein GY745_10490 [Actinomycetia bacterium]|nr:hypothetical protein [Actinomycetes bacterium]
MPPTPVQGVVAIPTRKTRLEVFTEEIGVDIVITVAIVWGLVLLGEPLLQVVMSPVFIILTIAGLAHLTAKTYRHDPGGGNS